MRLFLFAKTKMLSRPIYLSIQSPTDEENLVVREAPDDLRTLWVEYDAHGDRHKAWRGFTREATFEISKDWPF